MLYNPTAPRAELDLSIFWSALLLLSIGLVMVYSASIAMAEAEKMTAFRSHYFLMRHAIYVGLGLVAAAITFQIPIAAWQRRGFLSPADS
jgi:cell division protein FtsW